MITKDYHIHSYFCDGENSPEEIVLKAIEKGMTEIGILTHSFTFFDQSYCIKKEQIAVFQAEINRLKEKYKGKISILCGVEQDFYSTEPTNGFDYVIGSVHYIKSGNDYLTIDESLEGFKRIAKDYFNGDYYALADAYYKTVAEVGEKTNPNIIGHFDLVTKFNEGNALFSETDSRYINSYRYALDKLLLLSIPFEINYGAITRGYRSAPYPNGDIIDYITKNGGKLIPSSDCHRIERWDCDIM